MAETGGAAVPGTMLGQLAAGAASEAASNNNNGVPDDRVPRAPRSGSNSDNDGAVQIVKWRGTVLSEMTWDEWVRYHYQPARQSRRQLFKEARPPRTWTAHSEYNFLDNCVDHSVKGIQNAKKLLVDEGVFDNDDDDLDYNTVTDLYKGHLKEVGNNAVVESKKRLVENRAEGFSHAPTELARDVRAAHVARFGSANFSEANKRLFEMLVLPWANIPELKTRVSTLRWDLQEERFSEDDNLMFIAQVVQKYEGKALMEETDQELLRRDYLLQRKHNAIKERSSMIRKTDLGAGGDTV